MCQGLVCLPTVPILCIWRHHCHPVQDWGHDLLWLASIDAAGGQIHLHIIQHIMHLMTISIHVVLGLGSDSIGPRSGKTTSKFQEEGRASCWVRLLVVHA